MDAKIIYDEMKRLDEISGLPISQTPVRISKRMKTSYGNCTIQCRNGKWSVKEFAFAARMLEKGTPEHIIETVRHEYAHAYVTLVHNRNCHHNYAWQAAALRFGSNGKATETYDEVGTGREAYKYIVTCDHCGAASRYQRKSKIVKALEKDPDMRRFICVCCGKDHFSLTTVSNS